MTRRRRREGSRPDIYFHYIRQYIPYFRYTGYPPPKPGVRGVKMRNVKTGDLRTQKCLKNVGILTPRRGYIINIGGILGVFLTSKKGVLFSVKKPLKHTLYTCKLNIIFTLTSSNYILHINQISFQRSTVFSNRPSGYCGSNGSRRGRTRIRSR